MVYETLHECEVYWRILKKVPKGGFRKENRGDRQDKVEKAEPKKYIEKKP